MPDDPVGSQSQVQKTCVSCVRGDCICVDTLEGPRGHGYRACQMARSATAREQTPLQRKSRRSLAAPSQRPVQEVLPAHAARGPWWCHADPACCGRAWWLWWAQAHAHKVRAAEASARAALVAPDVAGAATLSAAWEVSALLCPPLLPPFPPPTRWAASSVRRRVPRRQPREGDETSVVVACCPSTCSPSLAQARNTAEDLLKRTHQVAHAARRFMTPPTPPTSATTDAAPAAAGASSSSSSSSSSPQLFDLGVPSAAAAASLTPRQSEMVAGVTRRLQRLHTLLARLSARTQRLVAPHAGALASANSAGGGAGAADTGGGKAAPAEVSAAQRPGAAAAAAAAAAVAAVAAGGASPKGGLVAAMQAAAVSARSEFTAEQTALLVRCAVQPRPRCCERSRCLSSQPAPAHRATTPSPVHAAAAGACRGRWGSVRRSGPCCAPCGARCARRRAPAQRHCWRS